MFKSGSYLVCVFTDKYELARLRRSEAIFQPLRINVLGSLRNVKECICEGLPVRGKGALRSNRLCHQGATSENSLCVKPRHRCRILKVVGK